MEKANKKAAAANQGKSQTTATERKPRSVSKSVDKAQKKQPQNKSKGRASTSKGRQTDVAKKGDGKKAAGTASKSKPRDDSKKKAEKKKDDDNTMKPSRPLSAYIYFSTEWVPKIKKDEGLDHRAAMSRAGEIWNTMKDDEKKKFNDLHDKDVKRQEKQLKELKDKGYFILDDGTKSTDHQVSGKKKASKSEKKEKERKRGSAVAPEGKKAATAKKPQGKKATKQQHDESMDKSEVE